MPDHRPTSLKQHSLRYAVIIFMVIFIASVLHYLIFSLYLKSLEKEEQQKLLVNTSHSISRSINFYQRMVDQISQQIVVADLIRFHKDESVQAWSDEMRKNVPDSIGFTVFDAEGHVLGIPDKLMLGQQCIIDLKSHLQGENISLPAIHRGIKGLEHFDVISPVEDSSGYIGLAFSSFSLTVLADLLSDVESDNRAYRLVTENNEAIVETSNLDSERQDFNYFRHPVDGTDWSIEMFVYGKSENILLTSLLISNFITFLLVSGVLYFATSRLFNMVIKDFEIIGTMMSKIRSNSYELSESDHPRLKEFRDVIRFMQYSAEELNRYQRKLEFDSTTDELTGLYNRRYLNQALEKHLKQDNHDNETYLLIIDIDYFKEINDSYGHDVGDQVLLLFSRALKHLTKSPDVCTRVGGDEFIVMLLDYTQAEVKVWYDAIKQHMVTEIESYNLRNTTQIQFGLSVGCTLIRNSDNKGAILKRADDALYKVKFGGRHNIQCL